MTTRQVLNISAITAASAALAGAVFAMWVDNGPRLFMALAESGLAWCF
jgi:hypothetical protein